LTDAAAGGLCFFKGFRGTTDVLFALLQGTPADYIVGIYVRPFQSTGVIGEPATVQSFAFGFASNMATVTRGRTPITYTITMPGPVSLKVYDATGRLVKTLVENDQGVGDKSVFWDGKDLNDRSVPPGVYFLELDAEQKIAVRKLILVR
jgi:flagellar hook assembly protein FlgD